MRTEKAWNNDLSGSVPTRRAECVLGKHPPELRGCAGKGRRLSTGCVFFFGSIQLFRCKGEEFSSMTAGI